MSIENKNNERFLKKLMEKVIWPAFEKICSMAGYLEKTRFGRAVIYVLEKLYNRQGIMPYEGNRESYISLLGAMLAIMSFLCYLSILIAGEFFNADWALMSIPGIVLCSLAGLMDKADGIYARLRDKNTEFGPLYDAHCDKIQYVFKCSALIIDSYVKMAVLGSSLYFVLSIILLVVMVDRDLRVMFHRAYATKVDSNINVSAGIAGKVRTVFSFIALPLVLLLFYLELRTMIVYIALYSGMAIVTWVSLYIYIKRFTTEIANALELAKAEKKKKVKATKAAKALNVPHTEQLSC